MGETNPFPIDHPSHQGWEELPQEARDSLSLLSLEYRRDVLEFDKAFQEKFAETASLDLLEKYCLARFDLRASQILIVSLSPDPTALNPLFESYLDTLQQEVREFLATALRGMRSEVRENIASRILLKLSSRKLHWLGEAIEWRLQGCPPRPASNADRIFEGKPAAPIERAPSRAAERAEETMEEQNKPEYDLDIVGGGGLASGFKAGTPGIRKQLQFYSDSLPDGPDELKREVSNLARTAITALTRGSSVPQSKPEDWLEHLRQHDCTFETMEHLLIASRDHLQALFLDELAVGSLDRAIRFKEIEGRFSEIHARFFKPPDASAKDGQVLPAAPPVPKTNMHVGLLLKILAKKQVSIETWAADHKFGRTTVFDWRAARQTGRSPAGKVSGSKSTEIEKAIEDDAAELGLTPWTDSD